MATIVVGHGRSPEGKGWGSRIDAADYVIRMWDWHWQQPADHGERYDVGLFEIHPRLYPRFDDHNCRQPTDGWLGSLIKWSVESAWLTISDLPAGTRVVDQARWAGTGRALGGLGTTGRLALTRGTIAACWALEAAPAASEVILVGFDNVRAGQTLPLSDAFSQRYRSTAGMATFLNYRPGVTKAGNHDLAVERRLMEHVAANRGVVLSFAQEVW